MLKISIKESKTRHLLILEGKLIEPWTDELKTICQDPAIDPGERKIVIDLRGVTDISAEGEETLLSLMVQGARFRGSGVYTKQVLKRIVRQVRRDKNA
jgi:anti-anti-sigma regulatory factor